MKAAINFVSDRVCIIIRAFVGSKDARQHVICSRSNALIILTPLLKSNGY